FSHPSFLKTSYDEEDEVPRELDNVAIRYTKDVDGKDNPLRNHDLILMGDIRHVTDEKLSRTEFVVKGIAMLNKAPHRGEVKHSCSIMCRVVNTSMEAFFTEEGKLGYNAPRNVYEKTVLDESLIRQLNETYIVQNYTEVLGKLNDWADFLKSERDEADANELRGYSIERPRFFTAVPVNKNSRPDREILVETPDNFWIDSTGSTSRAHLIVQITHVIEPRLFESDERYVEKFNSLSALGVRIVDPASVLAENGSGLDSREYQRSLRMMAVGNVRLSPAIMDGPLANDAAAPLMDWKKRETVEIRRRFNERLRATVDTRMLEMELTEEESAAIEADLAVRAEEVQTRAASLRDAEVDAISETRRQELLPQKTRIDEALGTDSDSLTREEILEKLPEDLRDEYGQYSERRRECRRSVISEGLPLEGYVDRAREMIRCESRDQLLADRRRNLEKEVRGELAAERDRDIESIEKEFRRQLMALGREGEKSRLTVFYDIELPPSTNPYTEREERDKFFARSSQYKMVYDSAGAQAALERQKDALDSFMNGEVSNPFLASYLFSTEYGKTAEQVPIGHYFGTMFNETQKKAITEAVNSDGIYLIQGPPGTGKTQVISEITMQMVARGKKVMITSQNNKAIDNAFGKLPNSPLIRSVRLMAKGKDSEFDLDSLVENYYSSLAEMLEKQRDLILSDTLLEALRRDGKRLEELYDSYLDCIEKGAKAIKLAEEDRQALVQATVKHDKGVTDARSSRLRIAQIEYEMERIDYFELSTYNRYRNDILALFPAIQIPEKNKRRADEYRASRVFGKLGYCGVIMTLSDEEFAEQVDFISDNPEYVSLYSRLCREGQGNDQVKAQGGERLDQYRMDKGVQASQLGLLEAFGADLPRDLQNIRATLKKIRTKVASNLRKRLKYAHDMQDKDFNAEKSLKNIELIRADLADDLADPRYVKYNEAETELRIQVQTIFNELNLADKFESLDDAFSIIDRKIKDILSMTEEERRSLADMYDKSARHLRKNGIGNVMHDEILSRLKNYVNVVGMTCTADGRPVTEAEEPDNRKNFDYWSKLGAAEVSSDSKLVLAQEELEEMSFRKEGRALLDDTTMGIDVVIVDEVSKVPFC
ncbi:MAG: AAA family ATPase, partial [archaeon]|nr:AAA family ATPase [archaeon]